MKGAKTAVRIHGVIDYLSLFEFTKALTFVQCDVIDIVRYRHIPCFREIFRLRIAQHTPYRIGGVRIFEMPCPADFSGTKAYSGDVGNPDRPIAKFIDGFGGKRQHALFMNGRRILGSPSPSDVHTAHERSGYSADPCGIGEASQIDTEACVFLLAAGVGSIGEKTGRLVVFVRKRITLVDVKCPVRFVLPRSNKVFLRQPRSRPGGFRPHRRHSYRREETVDTHFPRRDISGTQYDARQ